jgi:hypothetical protein
MILNLPLLVSPASGCMFQLSLARVCVHRPRVFQIFRRAEVALVTILFLEIEAGVATGDANAVKSPEAVPSASSLQR